MEGKSRVKVTKGGGRPGPVRRQTPHQITPGRLRLAAALFIFAFLISSIPLGAADQNKFSFVLVGDLKGEVVDNDTGAPVDNVTIWGEIHSTTLYFWTRFSRNAYSYKIWNENKRLIRFADDLPTVGGTFALPISDLLGDNNEHHFQLEASASGYVSTNMEGTFTGEGKFLQIKLAKVEVEESSDGDFNFDLGSSQGVVIHKQQDNVGEVRRERNYAQENWIPAGTSGAEARKSQLRAENKEAIIESRSRQEQVLAGEWETLFEATTSPTSYMGVGGYRVTSSTASVRVIVGYEQKWVNGYWTTKTVLDYGWKTVSQAVYNANSGSKYVEHYPVYGWTDTGEIFVESWGNGKPNLSDANYRWVEVSKGYTWGIWTTTKFKKQRWGVVGQNDVYHIKDVVGSHEEREWVEGYWTTDCSKPVYETRYSTVYTAQRQKYEWRGVTRDYIVGEQWTELSDLGTWVWEPGEVEVPFSLGLTSGTRAEVQLEVYAPAGIEAELDMSEFQLPYTAHEVNHHTGYDQFSFTISGTGGQASSSSSNPFRPAIRLRVEGSPGVKNTITVSARRADGGVERIREYTLWAFEDGDIGQVVSEHGAPYSRAGKDDSKFWWADSQSLARSETGEFLVKAGSMGAGYADAWVVQYLEGENGFTPTEEDVRDGITVEGQMSLKAFVLGDAWLAGVSYGHATGLLEAGDRSNAQTLAWSLEADVGAITTVADILPRTISDILSALDHLDAVTNPIQITNKVNDLLNAVRRAGLGNLETEVIRYSPEGLQAGQRYRLGAGVKVVSASGGFAGNAAAVVGKVDYIRVRTGAASTLELKFNTNERPFSDTSGMKHQAIYYWDYVVRNGLSRSAESAEGLRSKAMMPHTSKYWYSTDDPTFTTLDPPVLCTIAGHEVISPFYTETRAPVFVLYKNACKSPVNALKGSYEAWVEPLGNGNAKIISIGDGIRLGTCSDGFRFQYDARIIMLPLSVIEGHADLKADYTPGEWHHVVATWYYGGSELATALYVNGQLVTGTPLGNGERPSRDEWPAAFITNPPVEIGEDFNGLIDEVCVYGTVLTREQVQVRWQAGPSP